MKYLKIALSLTLVCQTTFCLSIKDYKGTYHCVTATRFTPGVQFGIETYVPKMFQNVKIHVIPLDKDRARLVWKEESEKKSLEIGPFKTPDVVQGFEDKTKALKYEKVESPTVYRVLESIHFSDSYHGKVLDMDLRRKDWRFEASQCRTK